MPDLREDEIKKFRPTSIVFQFPDHAHVPSCAYRPATCDDDLETVADHYLRQSFELMRRLAGRKTGAQCGSEKRGRVDHGTQHVPQHRVARLDATAAVSEATSCRRPSNSAEPLDHREDFLRHLQRRMDFIAEVATSERSLWSQPLGLRSVLERLDFRQASAATQ